MRVISARIPADDSSRGGDDRNCNFSRIPRGKCERSCNSSGKRVYILLSACIRATPTPYLRKARARRVSAFPPPSPLIDCQLPLTYSGGTALRIYVPEHRPSGEVLDPDFAGHFGSRLPAPHDAELTSRALVKNVDGISRLQLSVNALQGGSSAADGAQADGL